MKKKLVLGIFFIFFILSAVSTVNGASWQTYREDVNFTIATTDLAISNSYSDVDTSTGWTNNLELPCNISEIDSSSEVLNLTSIPVGALETESFLFNSYDEDETWYDNLGNSVDGNKSTYTNSMVIEDDSQLYDANNCTGSYRGVIKSVTVSNKLYANTGEGDYMDVDFIPVFNGTTVGETYTETVGNNEKYWIKTDITNDTNKVGQWTWNDIQNLDFRMTENKNGELYSTAWYYTSVNVTYINTSFLCNTNQVTQIPYNNVWTKNNLTNYNALSSNSRFINLSFTSSFNNWNLNRIITGDDCNLSSKITNNIVVKEKDKSTPFIGNSAPTSYWTVNDSLQLSNSMTYQIDDVKISLTFPSNNVSTPSNLLNLGSIPGSSSKTGYVTYQKYGPHVYDVDEEVDGNTHTVTIYIKSPEQLT
ncbi:MAG: hypothetical protein ACOC80_04960, partial [Petrotogales bacterium]